MKILRLAALIAVAFLASCSSVSTRAVVDVTPFKTIYVVHRLTDDRHIDEMFVAELQRLGHIASCGPLTMLPDNTDAILTYEDRWEWDFKTYLIELTFTLQTARTEKKIADGRFYQPTPKAKPPAEVVHELLGTLVHTKVAK